MKKMSSGEIRSMFFRYFEERGHLVIPSASLITQNDPTLLWVNAGVTPLKKYFDGTVVPKNKRLVSSQKCIRTNDIEKVGETARHHTFFEMLGNFSIGDYFKKEAIGFCYEFLTSTDYLGLDKDRLYMTIYPADEEAYDAWLSLGVEPSHIIKLEDNYWEIGEGPSGPDSEVFYDKGVAFDPDGRGLDLLINDIENERYVEIWNNVFSQYNAKEGVPREEFQELPTKNIDVGCGLERLTGVVQQTKTQFETDLFMPIISEIEKISGTKYEDKKAYKVISDHIRAITFALSDGAFFSNEGRGYVLRRLLRRSVRYGKNLGIEEPFLYKLIPSIVNIMKDAYPELIKNSDKVSDLVLAEEKLFDKTLVSGEKKLNEILETCGSKVVSGQDVFKLYDTYGFPCELTMECLQEHGFSMDKDEFDRCMKDQKEKARNARTKEGSMNMQNEGLLNFKDQSTFIGYDFCECEAKIIALMKDDVLVSELTGEGYIVLDQTPFYAEAGGQVSDTGTIVGNNFEVNITDVIKAPNKQHLHFGKIEGIAKINDTVKANIDINKREDIAKNHSATHLLQESLREALSFDIEQAGSKVNVNNLRFDFAYEGDITDQEMVLVEQLVNEKIRTKVDTVIETMTLEEAKGKNAICLFEDKYEEQVRVVTLYDAIELCGGIHVKNLGDIKAFAIKTFESKGSNIYRIEATTDKYIKSELYEIIEPYNGEMLKLLAKAKNIVKEAHDEGIELYFNVHIDNSEPTSYADIVYNRHEVINVREKVKELEKKYEVAREKKALADLSSFDDKIIETGLGKLLVSKTVGYEVPFLKELVNRLLEKVGKGFVFIANVVDSNVNYIAKSHEDLADIIDCGELVKDASANSSGNGGGSKTFAQGGGTDISRLDDILENIKNKFIA